MEPVRATGVDWFEEDDYAAFRSTLPDRQWHATYAQWRAAAEQTIERFRNQGIVAVKAKARSAEFIAWCKSTSRNVDADALTAYAAEAAYREIMDQH